MIMPSTWMLLAFACLTVLYLGGACWAMLKKKATVLEVFIAFVILCLVGAILFPVYVSQAGRDAAARWYRIHPHSHRHFE